MNDELADNTAEKTLLIPEGYQIDSKLVDEWEALEKSQKFEPVLPRLAWDNLYRAIELLNFSVNRAAHVGLAARTGNIAGLDDSLDHLAVNTVLTQNALKQFQEMMMRAAVDSVKGANGNG